MSTPAKKCKPKKKTVRRDSTARKPRRRRSVKTRVVEKLLRLYEKGMKTKSPLVSVADLVRLMQIPPDAEEEEAKEIRVTWVEPSEMESVIKT